MFRTRSAVFPFVSLAALVLGAGGGCLDRPIATNEPRTTKSTVETLKSTRVEKIDLLLAIDNSISMRDKQKLLGEAVPHLVDRLVNPRCVDPDLVAPVAFDQIPQPADPLEACPTIMKGGIAAPTEREFEPVKDIHVGIISSSLGDLNGGTCGVGADGHPDDEGHLLDRIEQPPEVAQTFEDKHFLLWDPAGQYGPKTDAAAFKSTLTDMVVGVGQDGCGFEMQLESVYRFLVDPAPYASLTSEPASGPDKKVKSGVDKDLTDMRANFLREDSLVAIVMLSDENDCSVQAEGFDYLALSPDGFQKGSAACANDPDDPCCYTCSSSGPPAGCEPDPACAADPKPDYDSPNLRCWEQKKRMGIDALYPVARYANAFTLKTIDPKKPDLVPTSADEGQDNPLLVNRPDGLVYFAGIVGVPWQAIANKNDSGEPDLTRGYMTQRQMQAAGLFEALAGDPDAHEPPTDPFMVESVQKRSVKSPLLGVAPNQPNDINGGDRTPSDDMLTVNLQYTCMFDVDDVANGPDCKECADGDCDNPACDGTTQIQAKALPGLRQLSLIEKMGDQGIAASVCPATTDPQKDGYGYDPAVGAIIESLKTKLRGQQCLDFSIEPDDNHQVTCLVMESRRADTCACDLPGRTAPPAEHSIAIESIQQSSGWDPQETCFCEVDQLAKGNLDTCQNEATVPDGIDGWCYIDASIESPIGNPALVQCDANKPRIVRVVGDPEPHSGATLHIFCSGESND